MPESDCSGREHEGGAARGVQHRRPVGVRGRRGAGARSRRVPATSGAPTPSSTSARPGSRTRCASAGVGVGDHVGLYLRNSVEHVEVMLACYKARAVPINVNYRYVADELRYLCDDADLVALFHDADTADVRRRGRAPRAARSPSIAGSPEYEQLVQSGSAARDLGPRSPDDHYVLYTGGTTGRPKGVVWRQEDMFFGGLGSGNPGRSADHRRRSRSRPRRSTTPRNGCGRSCRRATRASRSSSSLALGPLMHASGQWSALGTLLGGGKVVLYGEPTSTWSWCSTSSNASVSNACNLVGDASARPMLERSTRSRTVGSLGAAAARLRRQHPVGRREGRADGRAPVGARDRRRHRLVGVARAGGRGHDPRRRAVGVAARSRRRPTTIVVDERPCARCAPEAASSAGSRPGSGPARLPQGSRAAARARSSRSTAKRWSLPGDMATIDADGTIHLLGRGSMCINTGGEKVYPEEVEAVVKTHPRVADAVVLGVARRALRPARGRGHRASPPTASRRPISKRCRHTAAPSSRATRCRGRCTSSHEIARTPAGKADYAWARTVIEA